MIELFPSFSRRFWTKKKTELLEADKMNMKEELNGNLRPEAGDTKEEEEEEKEEVREIFLHLSPGGQELALRFDLNNWSFKTHFYWDFNYYCYYYYYYHIIILITIIYINIIININI